MERRYYKYTEYIRYVDFERLDFIIQSIRNHSNETNLKGLDVGCGKGNITVPLASIGYKMIGIDIAPNNIKVAKSKQVAKETSTFLVGDAENLTFKKENFDFVVCSEVLEHLNRPEKALNSINEVLKENGILIVTVPNGYGPYSLIFDYFRNKVICKIFPKITFSDHIQAFTLSKINKIIKKAGFENLNVNHSDFVSFLWSILAESRGLKKISYYDCKIADRLPPHLVSGYYIACKKKNDPHLL
jgi:ubiquinone biosynthesis O-methyltransferase